jgi:HEAT repeat protein
LQDAANYVARFHAAENLGKGGAWARPAIPALSRALEDPHPRVRLDAARALEKLEPGKHKLAPVFLGIMGDGDDMSVRTAAVHALGALGPAARDAVPRLRAAVRGPDAALRYAAHEALGKIEPKSALPAVLMGY